MSNVDEELKKLEKKMKKLRLKLKRAMDNQTSLFLTANDIALLELGILREWVDDPSHDDA